MVATISSNIKIIAFTTPTIFSCVQPKCQDTVLAAMHTNFLNSLAFYLFMLLPSCSYAAWDTKPRSSRLSIHDLLLLLYIWNIVHAHSDPVIIRFSQIQRLLFHLTTGLALVSGWNLEASSQMWSKDVLVPLCLWKLSNSRICLRHLAPACQQRPWTMQHVTLYGNRARTSSIEIRSQVNPKHMQISKSLAWEISEICRTVLKSCQMVLQISVLQIGYSLWDALYVQGLFKLMKHLLFLLYPFPPKSRVWWIVLEDAMPHLRQSADLLSGGCCLHFFCLLPI